MTVAELIAELKKMPGDLLLYVADDSDSSNWYRSGELSIVAKESVMHPDYPHAKAPVLVLT